MNVQKRAELGIGYYYRRAKDGAEIYIPIERGESFLQKWLEKNDEIDAWVKVEVLDV